MQSVQSLIDAAVDAGTKRVRPLLVTVMTNIFGLLPVLVDEGVGAARAKGPMSKTAGLCDVYCAAHLC